MDTLRGRATALVSGTAMRTGSFRPYQSTGGFTWKSKYLSSSSSSNTSNSTNNSDDESEFERLYKYHQHLLAMDAEEVSSYLTWLNDAYKQAYANNEIELDDYYKYEEEVYSGLQDLFKDYINDVAHEISMREMYENDAPKILNLYQELLTNIEKEIAAARASGLDDTDDYIQDLQSEWQSYYEAREDMLKESEENAKDSIDELINIRLDMIKQEIENEKDAINERLDYLKEFYDKQKEMLQDQYDEEKYLEEQAEHRKSVSDIQAEIAQLEYDNSAWAQKRKLELAEELADAQKELNDFEKDHALQSAQDQLDSLYEMQEEELNAQLDILEQKEDNAKALYDQALADIKNGSVALYEEMIAWNNQYGDGIEATIKDAWEEAYIALDKYYKLYGKYYEDIHLDNATGYQPPTDSWDSSSISGTNPNNTPPSSSNNSVSQSTSSAPSLTKGSYVTVKPGTKWYGDSYGGGSWGVAHAGTIKYINASGSHPYNINGAGWVRKEDIVGYATGTRNASAGLHSIDEQGAETIFTSSDGTKYRMFTGGEKVLNAKASNFLYDFANSGGSLFEKILNSFINNGLFNKLKPTVIAPNISMGNIIIEGNTDRQTVSEIRRAQRDNLSDLLKSLNKLNK